MKNVNLYKKILPSSMKITDLNKIIKQILNYLKKRDSFRKITLLIFDNDKKNIVTKAIAGKNIQTKIINVRVKITDTSLIKEIIRKKEPEIINPKSNDPLKQLIKKEKNNEFVALPLIGNRKPLGIIICEYTKEELGLLKDVDRISKEIGNIIYISSMITNLERKVNDMNSISKISKEMITLDIDKLFKHIVQRALKRVNAKSASIMLLEKNTLYTQYAQGFGIRKRYKEIIFKKGQGAAGIVAESGKQVFIENKIKDKRYIDVGSQTNTKNSYLGLPLKFKNKVVGVLNIDFQDSSEITDDTKEFLEILTSNAAITIRNTQLYNSSLRRIKRLSAIYDITKTISATLDLEKVLDVIVIKIIKIVNANICSVYLLNKEKTHLIPKSIYNMNGSFLKRQGVDIKNSFSGDALLSKQIIYKKDIHNEKRFADKEFAKLEKLKSFLSIPLIIENKGIGVINIYTKKIRSFSKDELNLLKSFADQAAIAIEKAILYRHIKNDKEKLSKILGISNKISSTLDFDKLLNLILKESIEITKSKAGVLMLKEKDEIYVHDSIGYNLKQINHLRLRLGEGITGHVAKTGKPEFVVDVTKDKRFHKGIPSQKSEMALPIMIRGTVFGVLNLDSDQINNYEKYKEILEILMDRIAVAIENSWLHKKTENFNEKLKKEVKIATKSILDANRRLIKMDSIKSDFVSNVSHELRTPLTSIMGYSKLILSKKLGELTDKQEQSLKIIVEESERLTRLINDILDLSKLEKGKINLKLELTDINQIISEVVNIMCTISEEKCIRVQVKPGKISKIYLDKDQIKQVLNNLLSNALKFTGEKGNITISSKESKDYIIVEVKDTGRGISKKQIPKLFNKFYQVDPSLTKITSGTGLGLPIAQHIVKMHQGNIFVKSKLGVGSTFSFTISKKLNQIILP